MPLIGVIDPRHDERKRQDNGRYPAWMSLGQLLSDSEVASPKYSPWPHELLAAALNEHQERGERISVTTLTGGCKRGTLVERKCDYIGKMDDMYAAFRGTMVHRILESAARPGSLAEWRFYTDIDGTEISGSPDLITYDTVWDYKTTEKPPQYNYMWNDHKLQLNFNRFIFNNATKWEDPNGVPDAPCPLDPWATKIQHLAIVYLGPQGPKVIEAEKSVEVPGRKRKSVQPDVWSDKVVLDTIRPMLKGWKMAWDNFPNWPAGLEDLPGWEGPPSFQCSGPPLCYLPNCMAKRYPDNLTWDNPTP